MHWKILNYFTNHEKLSLDFLIIILHWYLRLNTKHLMENEFQLCQH